jgi:hypothetical protein
MGRKKQSIAKLPGKATKMGATQGLYGTNIDRLAAQTWCGQAHWAEGPQTCGKCHYFAPHPQHQRCFVCHLVPLLQHGLWGAQIPKEAPSCKHFVQKANDHA